MTMPLYMPPESEKAKEAARRYRQASDMLLMSVEYDELGRLEDAKGLLAAFHEEKKRAEAAMPGVVVNAS